MRYGVLSIFQDLADGWIGIGQFEHRYFDLEPSFWLDFKLKLRPVIVQIRRCHN